MKRKLMKQGNASLVISLPSKWIKENNLKKGEEINIEEINGCLNISTSHKEIIKKTRIDFGKETLLIRRFLANAYRQGYDEIECNYSSQEINKQIQKTINELLMGFEIIEQNKRGCIIKSLTHGSREEFNNLFRRAFFVTLNFAEIILEKCKNKNNNFFEEDFALETTNNKLTLFCQRLICKKNVDNKEQIFLFTITYLLEKICDEYKYLCYSIEKQKLSENFISVLSEVNNYFRTTYETYFNFSNEEFIELGKKRKELISKLKSLKEKEIIFTLNLINIVQISYNIIGLKFGINLPEN